MVIKIVLYQGNCICCEEQTKALPLDEYRSFLKNTSTSYKVFIVFCLTTFPPLAIVLLLMRPQDTEVV